VHINSFSSFGRLVKVTSWLRASAVIGLVSTIVTGCPGSLEEAERFSPDQLGLEAGACDPFGVMAQKCGTGPCHDATNSAAGLDLVTEGVKDRLVGKDAYHEDVTDPAPCKDGQLLIDPANIEESWMLRKINKTHENCGVGMPVSGRFPTADKECLINWIKSFAGSSTPTGGAGSGSNGGGAG
jgi:hypothetical protein